jgi:hypothetical protein
MKQYFSLDKRKALFVVLLLLGSQSCFAGVISSTARVLNRAADRAADRAAIAASIAVTPKAVAAEAQRAAENSSNENPVNIDLKKFTYYSMTEGLKKGIKRTLHGTMVSETGTSLAIKAVVITKPGRNRIKSGKEWITVNTSTEIRFDNETVQHKTTEFYDKSNNNLIMIVDQDDGSITEYKPLPIPQYINLNKTYTTDEVEVRNKVGAIISRGIVNFQATKTKNGIESCWIEYTISKKSKPTETISTSCEVFDEKLQPIHYKEELLENGVKIFSVTGKTEVK